MTAPGGILGAMKGITTMLDVSLLIVTGIGCFVAGVLAHPLLRGGGTRHGISLWVRGEKVFLPPFAMTDIVTKILSRDERTILERVNVFTDKNIEPPLELKNAADVAFSEAAFRWYTTPGFGLEWARRHLSRSIQEAWGIAE